MDKYDSFFPISMKVGDVKSDEALISVLTKNANELAEANRLKILEIKTHLLIANKRISLESRKAETSEIEAELVDRS